MASEVSYVGKHEEGSKFSQSGETILGGTPVKRTTVLLGRLHLDNTSIEEVCEYLTKQRRLPPHPESSEQEACYSPYAYMTPFPCLAR